MIGGGLPVGAYAGKREIMKMVAPSGSMYQAGTLSGNPLAMTAGLATIHSLLEPGIFEAMAARTSQLINGIQSSAEAANIPVQCGSTGSMFGFYFLKENGTSITDYASAKRFAHPERYAKFFHAMLEAGVYFAPSQFEAGFMSSAHNDAIVQETIETAGKVMKQITA